MLYRTAINRLPLRIKTMPTLHKNTPLVISKTYSERLVAKVWLKMDARQPSGSFKLRGIGYVCQTYKKEGAKGLICASGGNAGLAVAYAGRQLNLPVTIIVPKTTSQLAIDAIKKEKAIVCVKGESYQEAHEYALKLTSATQRYVHSYDDPLLWHGHATLVDEIRASNIVPDLMVLSVGGGGLLCGVLEGLARNGWDTIPILAVETHGAHSLASALEAKEHLTLKNITSIATSLGAKKVAQQAFEQSQKHKVIPHVVSDREAVEACLQFAKDHQIIVEPACGAALAALAKVHPSTHQKRQIVVIVCGGVGTDLNQLQYWQRHLPPHSMPPANE